MPAPRLTYRLGRGTVVLQPDGSIEAVRPGPDAVSYLAGGGRVRVWLRGTKVSWSEPSVSADVDEVEFGFPAADGLGLVVRHSFTADWGVRVAFVNHTLEALTTTAELAWSPADLGPAWVLAAGATGAYAIPGPEGGGPLLGGELVLGACDAVTGTGIGLGGLELGPLERRVVQWRWAWYANARTFSRNRFLAVPRDLVVPENESARIVADEDTAVVAPGAELVRRGPQLELSAPGGQRVSVEVRSRRGTTAYDLAWVEPLDDALTELGDALLDGPRTRTGVAVLPGIDAALVVQHLLARGRTGGPDQADDALGLFVTRMADAPTEDGRGVSLLCGEFDRTGDSDLLEQATAQLLRLDRPVPGLGLAAAQLCVARLSQGWPLEPVLTHLGGLAATPGDEGLDRVAADLEFRLTAAPRAADREPGQARWVDDRVRRVGAALGAGLPGWPLWPLPVDRQAHLSVVLGLLPEGLGARSRPGWGVSAHDLARHTQASVLARLAGQAARAAHSWLIMGGRLA